MKIKKIIASLLIIAIMISLMPMKIFAASSSIKLTITPSATEAHPGDEITYTVTAKMNAVQNLAYLKFKLAIPEGLTFVEGKTVDGLIDSINGIVVPGKQLFDEGKKTLTIGCDYSGTSDIALVTFKCSVDSETSGNKEVTLIFDEDDAFDTSYETIPVDYTNTGSTVNITPRPVPATGVTLNKTEITLERGKEEKLIATVSPNNSTDTLTWNSSEKTKVTVDAEGKIKAIAEGSSTITVTTTSGKKATCKVTVIKPICKHPNKSTVNATGPKCTSTGNNEYKVCDDCGKVFKADGTTETTVKAETIAALGHDFSIPKHDDNQHWNECSRCHVADTKINHVGEGEYINDSTNHWKVCGCGVKVDEEAHTAGTPVKENRHAATCTEDGSYDEVVYCSVCNYKISTTHKTEPATGHTEGEPVKENRHAATCKEDGSYDEVVYCSVCGDKISTTPKTEPSTGHKAGEPVKENIVPSTHLEEGSYDEVTYCSVCNEEMKREQKKSALIPHDGSASAWYNDETNHWKVCGCGTVIDTEEHKAATSVNEKIVPATCTEDGSHEEVIYCSVCNYEMSREQKVDKATGHTEGTPVNENVKAPTCTKDGSHDEVVYCSVCNEELSRTNKTDKATGHTEGTPVKENVKDATCTETGSYDEVVYCSVCNEQLSTTPKTIEAKGHTEGTPVIENEIKATEDKEGSYDEVVYCADCKKELSRTNKTTPKIVHEIQEEANSTYEDSTSKSQEKNNPNTPKTGDSSNMTLWIVGLTISGILFVIVLGCKVKATRKKGRH